MEGTLKILFNEDVKLDAELIWRELKKNNIVFKELLVDNKKDFIAGLESFKPDLIISDYSLPQFNGMHALQIRNEISPLTPFILVTGSNNETVAVDCMKAGADDYILKDNLSRLGSAVINSLNRIRLFNEKKTAEEALKESDERYRRLVEGSPYAIAVHSKGIFVFANDAAVRLMGARSPQELIGTPILNIVHPDSLDSVVDRLNKVEEGADAPPTEEKIVKFDGSVIDVEVVRIPYPYKGLIATQIVIHDITKRKEVENALIQSELRFKQISENFGEWIWEVDNKGMYTFSSPVVKEILGYEPEEIINKKYFYDFFKPEVREQFKQVALEAFARKDDFRNFINVNLHKDGTEVILSTSGLPLIDKSGNLIGYRGVDRDITEQNKSEESLRLSEIKYRSIFENVQDLYYESALDGTILEVSPSISNLSNGQYNREDLIGKSMYEFYSIPGERERLINELKSKGSISDYEIKLKNRDGSLILCSISSKITFDSKGIPLKIIGSIRDISRRKKAEEALERSKKEFQNYFESGSVGMSVTLPNKRWIEVNQKLCQMFGYSREELLGMTWMDLSHPDDIALNLELFQKSLEGKIDNFELEKRFICKDGNEIYVTLSVVCERNPDGTVHHFLASYIDVTERVLAAEKIQHERIMLRTLIDNLPDVIYVKDINGRKLISNIADYKSTGFASEEEVIGKTDIELFPGENGKRGHNDDMDLINSGNTIIGREEDFVDASGQKRWLLTSKVPLRDQNGIITGLVGMGNDITNRKKAEEELLQSYAFNESLLKTIPFGMDIVDETGTILFHSENFKRLFGEKSIGKKCWNLYRDDKKQCGDCPLKRGITVGETDTYESHGVMGDRIFEINHTGMMYQGKRAMLEIFQDITDRKINETELISAKEKAEESDKLKTAFLHNISHEIRTPMNAIVGFSAMLGEPDVDNQTRQSYIEMIMQGSNHLLSIISDIVDISNIEANLVKAAKNEINVNSALKSLYSQFLPKANEKNIKFFCKNGLSDADAAIITDNTKLNQILSNLLSNALKFTDSGSVELEYKKEGSYLKFSVTDTGIGIAQEFHKKIFDRFFQVESSISRLYEGTGLGLAISSAYVELLGGKMLLSSEPGKGTTFYFTLPYQKQVHETQAEVGKPVNTDFVFKKKMKILVAEDVESNFKLISYFLSGANAVTLRARNGKEAVDMCLSDRSIDMVLMDVKMPEMDGYTAAKLIREANISIPIIAQTAYADDKDKATEVGCNGFISKPFDKTTLLKAISELI